MAESDRVGHFPGSGQRRQRADAARPKDRSDDRRPRHGHGLGRVYRQAGGGYRDSRPQQRDRDVPRPGSDRCAAGAAGRQCGSCPPGSRLTHHCSAPRPRRPARTSRPRRARGIPWRREDIGRHHDRVVERRVYDDSRGHVPGGRDARGHGPRGQLWPGLARPQGARQPWPGHRGARRSGRTVHAPRAARTRHRAARRPAGPGWSAAGETRPEGVGCPPTNASRPAGHDHSVGTRDG